MQVNIKIAVAIALFIAFSIGLNLGLHGVISLHPSAQLPVVKSQTEQTTETVTITAPDKSPISNEVTKLPIKTELSTEETKTSQLSSKLGVVHDLVNERIKQSRALLSNDNSFITNKIPIVLLTCNRPQLLELTLKSLLAINGITKDQILIAQDGTMPEVAAIVKKNELTLIQNSAGLRGTDGGSRIAMHYKFSLSAAFDRNPSATAIIIVEDDLLFSPDFYEYFLSVAPIMETDSSVFVVSAWNDNGFKDKVNDVFALKRTDYFPGLGWMLSRKLYKGELEALWPHEHWDHWLRSASISKNREIVYPETPRTYHNGIKGTFMNLETHNKYFRDIGYNTDASVRWAVDSAKGGGLVSNNKMVYESPLYLQASAELYEYKIAQLIRQCKHVEKIDELVQMQEEVICLWINVNPVSEWRTPEFEPIATFFGVWHEHRRASHKGLHDFYWESNYILLLNCYGEKKLTYSALKPSSVHFIEPTVFDRNLLMEMKRKRTVIDIVKSEKVGESCDEVCHKVGKECFTEHLQLLNSCDLMKEQFDCAVCKKSVGAEQPAYVDRSAAVEFGPGECVVNAFAQHSTCAASHKATKRLCACH